jgi:hypothetical protein
LEVYGRRPHGICFYILDEKIKELEKRAGWHLRECAICTRLSSNIQAVAFNSNWRSVSELFGVMFQDYLAYTASACADHKTVPRRFNHFIGYEVEVVNP